jgi:hypothetical protein
MLKRFGEGRCVLLVLQILPHVADHVWERVVEYPAVQASDLLAYGDAVVMSCILQKNGTHNDLQLDGILVANDFAGLLVHVVSNGILEYGLVRVREVRRAQIRRGLYRIKMRGTFRNGFTWLKKPVILAHLAIINRDPSVCGWHVCVGRCPHVWVVVVLEKHGRSWVECGHVSCVRSELTVSEGESGISISLLMVIIFFCLIS